jgi:translation initiation factor IF-3
MAHTELGRRILDRLVQDLEGLAVVEAAPKQDGRNMVMVIAPTKKQVAPSRAEPPRAERAQAASKTEQG